MNELSEEFFENKHRADQLFKSGLFVDAAGLYEHAALLLNQHFEQFRNDLAAQLDIISRHWGVWYRLAETCAECGFLSSFWTEGEQARFQEDWIGKCDQYIHGFLEKIVPFVKVRLDTNIHIVPTKDYPVLHDSQSLAYSLLLSADIKTVSGLHFTALGRYRLAWHLFEEMESWQEPVCHCRTGLGYILACLGRAGQAHEHLSWVVRQTSRIWSQVCTEMLDSLEQ